MASPQDLLNANANLATLDAVVTSTAETTTDRLGQTKLTLSGFEDRATAAIQSTGWFIVGEFSTGFTYTARNQVGRDADGELWSYNGPFTDGSFVVSAGTVPSEPNYTNRGDAALRTALAATGGAVLVNFGAVGGTDNATGIDLANEVNALIDGAEVLPSIKQLRPTAGVVQNVSAFVEGSGFGGGPFIFYPDMSETLANGGTIIAEGARLAWNGTQADLPTLLNYVGSGNGCHVRVMTAGLAKPEPTPEMFGYSPNSGLSASMQIKACIERIGGSIKLSNAVYNIDEPIVIKRGTRIFAEGTVDTVAGKGAQIYLMDGSNCSMLQTELAAGIGTATHYYALQNIMFNGNQDGQTEEHDIVEFWGAWVGSYIKSCFIFNGYGQGLTLSGGSDPFIDDLWIQGCTTENGYGMAVNQGLSGTTRAGLIYCGSIYIENISNKKDGNPRSVKEDRSKGIYINRAVKFICNSMHLEGVRYGCDLESNHMISVESTTSSWIGLDSDTDTGVFRYIDNGTRAVRLGLIYSSQISTNLKFVSLKSGVTSNNLLPEYPVVNGNTFGSGYSASSISTEFQRISSGVFANKGGVSPVGAASSIYLGLYNSALTDRYYCKRSSNMMMIGSTVNQSGDVEFITIISVGNEGDRVLINKPLVLPERSLPTQIRSGSIWNADSDFGGGIGPVYQSETGTTGGSDFICTAKRASAAPTNNADYIGQIYVNIAASPRVGYLAVNVGTGASDWKQIT